MMHRYLPIACILITSSCLLRSNSASYIQIQLRNTASREYAPIAYDAPRMPEAVYPGGPDSLRAFFIRHFRYPAEAIRESAGGNVTVSFIMDENGNFYNMHVCSRPHGSGLEEEVLRVSTRMPPWKAPVVNGQAITTEVSLVVTVPRFVKNIGMQQHFPTDNFQVSWSSSQVNRYVRLLYSVSSYCTVVCEIDPLLEDSLINATAPEPVELPKIPSDEIICYFPPSPQFPGGEDSLRSFLSRNMEYPAEALQHKKSGTVFVHFIISETGQTEDHKVLNTPIGFGLEEEALRVVRLMPNWIPVKTNGKAEKTLYNLPIRFSMD